MEQTFYLDKNIPNIMQCIP